MSTPDGECVVILDNQKRALTMTMVTMEVAFTYNENDSFNQELKKTAISYTAAVSSPPGEGAPMNQWPSHADNYYYSVCAGTINKQPLKHGRQNGN